MLSLYPDQIIYYNMFPYVNEKIRYVQQSIRGYGELKRRYWKGTTILMSMFITNNIGLASVYW